MVSFKNIKLFFSWFQDPPVLARSLLIAFLGIPICLKLNFITYYKIFFSWKLISHKYQLWRLVTSFFIAPLNINLLFDSLLRYQALAQLEHFTFSKKDGIVFLLFGSILSILYAIIDNTNVYILTPVITMYIIYVWAVLNPALQIQFYFIPLKAKYFPWALLAVNSLVFDKYFVSELAGILIGNLYVTMHKWSPNTKRTEMIKSIRIRMRRMLFRTGKQLGPASTQTDGKKRLNYFEKISQDNTIRASETELLLS